MKGKADVSEGRVGSWHSAQAARAWAFSLVVRWVFIHRVLFSLPGLPPSIGCQRVGSGGGHRPPVQQRERHPAAALLPPETQLHRDGAGHHGDAVLPRRAPLRHEGEGDQHQQPVKRGEEEPGPGAATARAVCAAQL